MNANYPSLTTKRSEIMNVLRKRQFTSELHRWQPPCNDGSRSEYDKKTGLEVLQVNSIQSFVQAVDYLKFKLNVKGEAVYYRGQHTLYDTGLDADGYYLFQPSALRNIKSAKGLHNAKIKIAEEINSIRKMLPRFSDVDKYKDHVIEGLLQQYGIPTTWFDAVDNIWIALWFSCYRSDMPKEIRIVKNGNSTSFQKRSFVHMVRRCPNETMEKYSYLFILGGNPKDVETVDLRCTLPSDYIRPHVQHGIMIRTNGVKDANMYKLIKGVIRIRLQDALDWLGNGHIFEPSSIMPPPNYDSGFSQLLESESNLDENDVLRFPIYC